MQESSLKTTKSSTHAKIWTSGRYLATYLAILPEWEATMIRSIYSVIVVATAADAIVSICIILLGVAFFISSYIAL